MRPHLRVNTEAPIGDPDRVRLPSRQRYGANPAIDARTFLTDCLSMTAGEFIRRVNALGAARGVPVRFDKARGKGSHGTLYYGDRFTVVKDRRKECGPGSSARCSQTWA